MSVRFREVRKQLPTLRVVAMLAFLSGGLSFTGFAPGAEHVDGFESDVPSWQVVVSNRSDIELKSRQRTTRYLRSGKAAELLEIVARRDNVRLELHQRIPESVLLDDLRLSLAIRSSRGNARLAVRVVFPNQIDPRTGKVMTALVSGDTYTTVGEWQTLQVEPDRRALAQRVKRLRAELRSVPLDVSGAYADRAVLAVELSPGSAAFALDDLRWSGFVAPQREVMPISGTTAVAATQVAMKLDRLLIQGRPVVLRYVPHHGEDFSRIADLGLNTVWIDDYRAAAKIRQMQSFGLWAMATPPRGEASEPGPTGEVSISLQPFNETTEGVVAWNISTRAPASALRDVDNQVRLIRAADRERNRPIFGDIGGAERAYSRMLDAIGLSRHPLQTEFSLHDYRRFLSQKSQKLRPGSFVSTWVQTEIDPDNYPAGPEGPVPVVEPEQIRLLTWSAICAGCKGIGFWKRTAFDVDIPGARERELAIAIVNQEISLLEPWLATHSVIEFQPVPIQRAAERKSPKQERSLTFKSRARELREEAQKQAAKTRAVSLAPKAAGPDRIEMAIISGPNGQLLIPLWYQEGSQFVPGQMTHPKLEITIPGIQDTATIWEVSTTQVRSLPKRQGPGGTKVVLENFDQVVVLMISTDPNWGRILRRQIEQIQSRSASLWLSLAAEKLARVKTVDRELQRLGVGLPEADRLLRQAETLVKLARDGMAKPESEATGVLVAGYSAGGASPHNVRMWSAAALRALRILQRAHWDKAVSRQPSPLSSPWTVSFSTLPDHWRFLRQAAGFAKDRRDVQNLLPFGDFENTGTARIIGGGWKHSQGDLPGIQASAELTQLRGDSGTSLRLVAVPDPNQEIPFSLSGTPISIKTPPMPVKAGEILRIRGRVRVPMAPAGSLEGVTVYESLTGSRLHWKRTGGWKNFEVLREVGEDAEFSLKLTLHGLGEARFDDLEVSVWNPSLAILQEPIRQTGGTRPGLVKPADRGSSGGLRRLDFLRGLRRVP